MITLVIDASVAIKWVVPEPGTEAALALLRCRLLAPDLLIAECANILWKKARRGDVTEAQAIAAAALLASSDVELAPMRPMIARVTQLAVALDHPAYDCFYLALAETNRCAVVTADEPLRMKAQAYGATARVVRLKTALDDLGLAGGG